MQINKINLSVPTKSNTTNTQAEKQTSVIPCSAVKACPLTTLQAYNSISFGQKPVFYLMDKGANKEESLHTRVQLNSGKVYSLRLDSDIIDLYLSDDGKLNNSKIESFVDIYKTVLQTIIDKEEQDNAFLTSIANGTQRSDKKSKVLYLNPQDEVKNVMISTLANKEDDFLTTFFNGITNENLRKQYAQGILSECKHTDEASQQQALSRTMHIVDIFGYDSSSLNSKIKFIERLEEVETNYSEDNLIEDFIEECKNADGSFDLKFADDLLKLIRTSSGFIPGKLISHRSSILREFMAKDSAKSEKIADAITAFSEIHEVDDCGETFENFFIQSFNPITNEFDEKAFQKVCEVVKKVSSVTDEMPLENDEDLEKIEQLEVELVSDYLTEIRDEKTGSIKENHISFEEFLSKKDL